MPFLLISHAITFTTSCHYKSLSEAHRISSFKTAITNKKVLQKLAIFLAGSKSKEILAKNLKEVLHLLQQEEEEEKPSKKEIEPSDETDDQDDDPFYQNEDDCFGISLEDD